MPWGTKRRCALHTSSSSIRIAPPQVPHDTIEGQVHGTVALISQQKQTMASASDRKGKQIHTNITRNNTNMSGSKKNNPHKYKTRPARTNKLHIKSSSSRNPFAFSFCLFVSLLPLSFRSSSLHSFLLYVMTVGFSLPVNSFILLISNAILMSGFKASAVSWSNFFSSASYFSIYTRIVAPTEPVPLNR